MPWFTYAAIDASGHETTGTVEAATSADAAEQLTQRGLLPIRTVPTMATTRDRRDDKAPRKLPPADWLIFSRQMATLIDSAVPVDQALRLVAVQNARGAVGAFASRVADDVSAGRSLSDAMTHCAPDLPAFMPALVRAGEARGATGAALADLARIQQRRLAVSARIRAALLYPAVLIGVALLAVSIVLGVLVPTLLPLFQDAGRQAPTALRVAHAISRGVIDYWPGLLGGGALVVLVARAVLQRDSVRRAVDRQLVRVPIIGPLSVDTQVALIARTLGTLLRNGVPLVDALRVTTSVSHSRVFRVALRAATERVQEGEALSTAMRHDGVFPELALRFIAIGEGASRLDVMLTHLADATDAEATRRLDGALSLLSPLLTILIGVLIGGLVLSVMQAILSVNDLAIR